MKRAYKPRPSFTELDEAVRGRTMLCSMKLRFLYELAIITDLIPGDIAEAGVWEGGVIYMLASITTKTIHALDSWNGLPPESKADRVDGFSMPEGWAACKVPTEFLSKFDGQIMYHHGLFSNTLPGLAPHTFSLVHVDVDRYKSTLECIQFFWPRVNTGGFMVFDDYSFHGTPGAKKAVDECFSSSHDMFTYNTVLAVKK